MTATWQQEVRFASDFGGPFDIVAGGFYQKDKTDFCVAQLLGFLDLVGPPTPYGPWNSTPYTLCNAQNAQSKAVFAEGTFKFTDALTEPPHVCRRLFGLSYAAMSCSSSMA